MDLSQDAPENGSFFSLARLQARSRSGDGKNDSVFLLAHTSPPPLRNNGTPVLVIFSFSPFRFSDFWCWLTIRGYDIFFSVRRKIGARAPESSKSFWWNKSNVNELNFYLVKRIFVRASEQLASKPEAVEKTTTVELFQKPNKSFRAPLAHARAASRVIFHVYALAALFLPS